MMMDYAINQIFTIVLIIMALFLMLCMIKAVIGPGVSDRIVCINMMGSIVIVMIAILALKMKEGYLSDICIIYAMISFLAVVVLCKVSMGVYLQKRDKASEVDNDNQCKEGE